MDRGKQVRRKPKGSKKSKKGWRKNTDIQDIEAHLEELRKEERCGGIVADKPDQSLFFLDAGGVAPAVPIVKCKANLSKDVSDDDDDTEVYVPRKERFRKKLEEEAKAALQQRQAEKRTLVRSIWGQEAMAITDSFLEPTIKKSKKIPVTMRMKPAAALSVAVEVAAPGASYNPDYEAHQELLRKAHEEQLAKLKMRKQLNKKVKMVSVEQLKKQSSLWLKEMSEGLFDNSHKTEEDPSTVDASPSSASVRAVSAEDRKTRKQRRKDQMLKDEERQKVLSKKEKLKLHDIYRTRTMLKAIKADEKKLELRKSERLSKLEAKKLKPKRLSKHKFVEGEVVVQLSEDLSGSLRELKPEGNPLAERFNSLQKRNIIETRKPVVPHRKYKLKVYEKKSHKTKTIKEIVQPT